MSDIGANEPSRSVDARTGAAAARVDRRRTAQPSGWWGMVLFLCSEVTIFGSLFGTYYYLDFHVRHWPPTGIALPAITAPSAATGGLLLSVPMMWAAMRCARRARRRPAMAWVLLAFAVQAAFLGVQVVLYRQNLMEFSPRASAYGSIYFTLLAAHDAHVIVGLVLDVAIWWKLWRQGLSNYWFIGLRGVALYWYVVAGLAVLVDVILLTPSL